MARNRNTEVLSFSAAPEVKARLDAARGYMSRSAFIVSATLRQCEEIEAKDKRDAREEARAA